jgi:hypothetical protein
VPDVAYVCAGCATALGKALHAAAELVPELETAVARLARFGEPGPRSRGRAPAQPIRPDQPDADQSGPDGLPISWSASIAAGTVANTVSTWCRVVVDQRYGDRPPHGPICLECEHPSCERLHAWRRWMPPPTTLVETMRWLAGQLGWLRCRAFAAEAFDELGHVAGLVERAVDRPVERVDAGLCLAVLDSGQKCQRRLSAPPGVARVRCPGCGATHDAAKRRETLLGVARDQRGTATELAHWLTLLGMPTPADTVHKWVRRGRLLGDGLYPFREAERLRLRESRSAA